MQTHHPPEPSPSPSMEGEGEAVPPPMVLRPCEKKDMERVRALLAAAFRPTYVEEFPLLFSDDNINAGTSQLLEDAEGRLLSHVGMVIQEASIFGCMFKVACVGGVATVEAERKKGHASACLQKAMQVAYERGCDIVKTSGDRNLFKRMGFMPVGDVFRIRMTTGEAKMLLERVCSGSAPTKVPAGILGIGGLGGQDHHHGPPLASASSDGLAAYGDSAALWEECVRQESAPLATLRVKLRSATTDDLQILAHLHRLESAHWFRPRHFWDQVLSTKMVMNRAVEFIVVTSYEAERPMAAPLIGAYFIITSPARANESRPNAAHELPTVLEWAGDRTQLLQGLALYLILHRQPAMYTFLQPWDHTGIRSAREAGLGGSSMPSMNAGQILTPNTTVVLRFVELMEKFRPYFTELLGTNVASRVRFSFEPVRMGVGSNRRVARRPAAPAGTTNPANEYGGPGVYKIIFDNDEMKLLDVGSVTRLLFCPVNVTMNDAWPPVTVHHICTIIFPIPILMYGLNFV